MTGATDFTDPAVIAGLVHSLRAAAIDRLELTMPSLALTLVLEPDRPAPQPLPPGAERQVLVAPMAGRVLYHHPATPDHAAADAPGVGAGTAPRALAPGEAAAFVAIGPMLLAVPAPRGGTDPRRLHPAGALVAFADPLLSLEPLP